MKKNKLKIKKNNQINIKCFQFIWVNWSNLYLGKVPRVAIANTHINKTFINKIKYGILFLYL